MESTHGQPASSLVEPVNAGDGLEDITWISGGSETIGQDQ